MMRCPSCRTPHLVVIRMSVRGEPVTFRSCSACDRRWWESLDGRLPLSSVLGLARTG